MRHWMIFFVFIAVASAVYVTSRLYPPDRITIAAGPAQGAYVAVAERYAEVLARDNIQLEIVETEGSVENSGLLSAGDVDAAFLQGGIAVPGADVEAIGHIFYEPMVFLVRVESDIPKNPADWRGLRINSGAKGSGTEAAFRDLERVVGLSHTDNIHFEVPYSKAVAALLAGELDIAPFVAPLDAPYLKAAYFEPELKALALDHAEAISRRLEYASIVRIPAGGLLLRPVVPPRGRQFIALEARLAVKSGLHPALVNRLTMAAIELHRNRGIIADPGSFPSVKGMTLPVNNTARQLIQEGPSTWHDWLPYWIAAQINRVFLLLLPFIFIVVPLLRSFPAAYAFFMRRRVWKHYPEIRIIEDAIAGSPTPEDIEKMRLQLEELDERLGAMLLPASYRQIQYDARLHIELVQKRIGDLQNGQPQV